MLQAERAVIGCVLLEGIRTLPPLMAEEFFGGDHRLFWEAILEIASEAERVDIITLRYELQCRGQLTHERDVTLAHCYEDACFGGPNLTSYARIVRTASRERMKRQLGRELAERGFDDHEILQRLDELPGPLAAPMYDPAENWQRIVGMWTQGRIMTRFAQLDEMTGGLWPGDFIVVGGRTSHGKTSWLTDLALRLAMDGTAVEYLTLEDSPDLLTRRLIANRTGISLLRLKDGSQLTSDEFHRSEGAVREIQNLPLTITGLDHLRVLDEQAIVPRAGQSKADVVIVDHLQQITTKDYRRVDGLERVMRNLQAISLRDGKILILAAQLNREIEVRNGPPRLSDLRDCGAIEQAARKIYLLYWPNRHDRTRPPDEYELYLAKQTDGGTGMVQLAFEPWCGRFSDPIGS